MASVIQRIASRGLSQLPKAVQSATQYEVVVGSVMYGVSDDLSDMDINGFCIPSKDVIFPHLRGEIQGFGRQKKRFEQFQKHHVQDPEAGKSYDLTIYNVVKYFHLCMQNNPNMLDSLFAPDSCVLKITKVGNMVRDARNDFLHKGCWHRFKGYAYSQLHKARGKNPEKGSKRDQIRDRYGWDVKFGYHIVRLLLEVEQILSEGTVDLMRHKEHLKAIRRGEVSRDDVEKWATEKEHSLERLYETSSLPYSPDESKIKSLLLSCLEEYYGDLRDEVVNPDAAVQALRDIHEVIKRHQKLL